MRRSLIGLWGRVVFALIIFATLTTGILLRNPKWLSDFDQSFYITIAYDLVHHGVFSNGVFDNVDSTQEAPPPGRFFAPVYPAVVAALMIIDPRFARAADCSVESNAGSRPGSQCEVYARPAHLANALFLILGVLAVGLTAELIVGMTAAFWLAGMLATVALLSDADLFSFVMTESITFGLYSLALLAFVWSIKAPAVGRFLVAGALLGLLVLTRTSYILLFFIVPVLIVIATRQNWVKALGYAAGFVVACATIVSPWMARNALSVGHWGLTEEYGSATLIERFAFNDMTAREFFLSLAYCLPTVGPAVVETTLGTRAMERFVYHTPKSFFHVGRGMRDKLVEAHGRLDPLIGGIVREEMQRRWWRHLLVSLSLGWCGMWVGGALGLLLIPAFVVGVLMARDATLRLLLFYSVPAFAMLGLHALIANQYTRYNLILIGPFAAGATSLALTIFAKRKALVRQ
jgi:hypothetical protein